ncbi:MAG TPA: glucan biosynthesis protein [Caldilineae bacterium]|nr:glucan biosynthesis protein [Caldilineae bacterium]
MSSLLKFVGGVLLGAALGAGVYVVVTQDNKVGFIDDVKVFVNDVIAEGKQAAEMRRAELQLELGQKPGG